MSDKVAIVTAAGKGMGEACARERSSQSYRVVLMSLSDKAIKLADKINGIGRQWAVTEGTDLKA